MLDLPNPAPVNSDAAKTGVENMLGQKALVLLIEDNADHAELVIRSLGTAPI